VFCGMREGKRGRALTGGEKIFGGEGNKTPKKKKGDSG